MFKHIFLTRLKCIARDRALMFWTLIYPLILATFFSLAFGNLASADNFKSIPIAVVDSAEYQNDKNFQTALTSVSDDNADAVQKLFHVSLLSESAAADSLKSGLIKGYIVYDGTMHIVVKESGIDQTILKSFADNYLQMSSAYKTVLMSDPSRAQSIIIDGEKDFIQSVSPNSKPANASIVNYYALISMAVMMGGFFGKKEIEDIQADMTSRGARLNMSPVSKMRAFGYSMCAAILIQFISLLILIAYLAFALKVDFGGQIGYILILCFFGSLLGVSFGAFITAVVKGGSGVKTAVMIAVSMLLSSVAGLQAPNLKYIVTHAVPALAYINPANLITDAFYSLYYYTAYTRFFINVALLGVFSVVFFIVVVLKTRRQRYASL